MRMTRFLPLFILALVFNVEVMGAGACAGFKNYLDLVLNQQKTAARALEVQGRIHNLMGEGAEVSIRQGSGYQRVTITGYDNGELLYRVDGVDARKAIDDDFNSFFKLADELPPSGVVADLGDGGSLRAAPIGEPDSGVPTGRALTVVERTEPAPFPVRIDPDPSPNLSGLDTTPPRITGPPEYTPPQLSGPVGGPRVVEEAGPNLPVVRDGDPRPGGVVSRLETPEEILPDNNLLRLTDMRGPDPRTPRLPGDPEIPALPNGTVTRIDTPRDGTIIDLPEGSFGEIPALGRVEAIPLPPPSARRLARPAGVAEESIPMLTRADFPSNAERRVLNIKALRGGAEYTGEIVSINDQSVVLRINGQNRRLDFRDLDSSSGRFLNDLGESDGLLELAEGVERRWIPTRGSFPPEMVDRVVEVSVNTPSGVVTHRGILNGINDSSIRVEGEGIPNGGRLEFRRIDASSIRFLDESEVVAELPIVRDGTTGLPVARPGTEIAPVEPAAVTRGVTLTEGEGAVAVRPREGGPIPVDATIDGRRVQAELYAPGEMPPGMDAAARAARSVNGNGTDIIAFNAGRSLADELAFTADTMANAVAEARRFAEEVRLPATADDLLGAFRDKAVRIQVGDTDTMVEGILRRIQGNRAVLEVDGSLRTIDLPDFNPNRFSLASLDDLGEAGESVILVDRAGNAIINGFEAVTDAGRAVPDEVARTIINRGRLLRMTDDFLEFIYRGRKIRVPRSILRRASVHLRRNRAIYNRGVANLARAQRPMPLLDEEEEIPGGATAGNTDPETAATPTPGPEATATPEPTPTPDPDADTFRDTPPGSEDGGDDDGGDTTAPPPAEPYTVDPNSTGTGSQGMFHTFKTMIFGILQ